MKSENTNELVTALAKAQAEMRSADLDKVNPHFKNKYSSLDAIWDACRTPLTKNGLSVTQTMDMVSDRCVLVTTLSHSSGQWVNSTLPIINIKGTPQSLGSELTYLRRYSLAAIVGVTSNEDDDAEEAQKNVKNVQKQDQNIHAEEPKEHQKISNEQFQQLTNLSDLCSEKYKESFRQHLTSKGIKNLQDLPVTWFDDCLKVLTEKSTLYQEHLKTLGAGNANS